jgi:DNA-binding GntR family transcriptional regulator
VAGGAGAFVASSRASKETSPLKPTEGKAAPPPRRKPASSTSSDEIHARIVAAITEHRLPPGMQLVEDRLAKIFDVSRTKIREATGRLVHDRIAVNIPNRGAFVASPTAAEAREVFAARALIEPELMRLAARNATPKQVASLRAHVRKETAARKANRLHAIITLSGEFHLRVAEIAGNGFLLRTLRELELLTSLVIRLYDTSGVAGPNCPYDDHAGLVDAIEAHDAARAASLMRHHLEHIVASLDLSPPPPVDVQLEDAFGQPH